MIEATYHSKVEMMPTPDLNEYRCWVTGGVNASDLGQLYPGVHNLHHRLCKGILKASNV